MVAVPIPVVVPGATPGDTPALTPEEPPAVPAAPWAAVPLVRAPAASAQPEDMASAVANTIVVIFITSVFLFFRLLVRWRTIRIYRHPSFQIGSINLS